MHAVLKTQAQLFKMWQAQALKYKNAKEGICPLQISLAKREYLISIKNIHSCHAHNNKMMPRNTFNTSDYICVAQILGGLDLHFCTLEQTKGLL